MELFDYLPIVVMVILGVGFAVVSLFISRLVAPSKPTPEKLAPYESGIVPLGDTNARFSVKFYTVAISFIIFDLEAIFLIPWAVEMRALGWAGFIAISIFTLVLVVGLIYEWRKGGLDWE